MSRCNCNATLLIHFRDKKGWVRLLYSPFLSNATYRTFSRWYMFFVFYIFQSLSFCFIIYSGNGRKFFPFFSPFYSSILEGIFVGDLDQTVVESDLISLFSDCGKVFSAVVKRDKYSGRSLGYGFVYFETEAGQQAALSKSDTFVWNSHSRSIFLIFQSVAPFSTGKGEHSIPKHNVTYQWL